MSADRQWIDWLIRLTVVAAVASVPWIGTLFVLSVNSEKLLLTPGEEKLFGAFDGAQVFDDPMDWELLAGRSATQDFYFELPRDPHWLARMIPGSETSFMHEKKVFAVQ